MCWCRCAAVFVAARLQEKIDVGLKPTTEHRKYDSIPQPSLYSYFLKSRLNHEFGALRMSHYGAHFT
jgi:hypothetical protein